MAKVKCKIVRKTEAAFLINQKGKEHWIPRSQISHRSVPPNQPTVLTIPDWLAEKLGVWYD